MRLLDAITRWFPAPRLTRRRVLLALAAAALTDTLQIALGPLGWVGTVQVLDAIACVLACLLLGFHLLLLPTFILEWFPVVDMLPTWTGCVMAVIALRRRQDKERRHVPGSHTPPNDPLLQAPKAPAPPSSKESRRP
ncbi:MAG: hypothetical protein RJA22_2304 [Verrucomicrobiota bacterium]